MGFRKRESNQEGFGIEKSNNKSVFRSANETPKKKKSTKRKKKASKPKMMNAMAEPKGAQMKMQNSSMEESVEIQEMRENPMNQQQVQEVLNEVYLELAAKIAQGVGLTPEETMTFEYLSNPNLGTYTVPDSLMTNYSQGGSTQPKFQFIDASGNPTSEIDLFRGNIYYKGGYSTPYSEMIDSLQSGTVSLEDAQKLQKLFDDYAYFTSGEWKKISDSPPIESTRLNPEYGKDAEQFKLDRAAQIPDYLEEY